MANRVIYLDIDDEITSAAARIREVETTRVAVVLPYGSRVATSRINFRLLSRDALTHDKWLSVVAGDSATRALAASAGLPVFASVAEYESSLEPRPDATSGPTVASAAAVSAAALGVAGAGAAGSGAAAAPATPIAPLAASATGATVRTDLPRPSGGSPAEPTPRPDLGGSGRGPRATDATRSGGGASRIPLLIGLGILGLAVLIAGVGAYLLLPSATIAVTPKTERIGPTHLTVTADTTATEPDPVNLVVPAQTVSVDVAANDTFQASGKRIEETKATGVVRFDNLDFLNTNTVPAGSIVGTDRGVRFRTIGTVTVPKADIVGLSLFPGRISVKVTAVKAGEDGNVDPNTITVVPAGEDPIALKVTNPTATSGGTHKEIPRVTQQDVDTAMAALNDALATDFQTKLADPALAPDGATVFPETAVLGAATADREARRSRRPGSRDVRPRIDGQRHRDRRRSGARLGACRDAVARDRRCQPPARRQFGGRRGRQRDRDRPVGQLPRQRDRGTGRRPRPGQAQDPGPGQDPRTGPGGSRPVRHGQDHPLARLGGLGPELREPGRPHHRQRRSRRAVVAVTVAVGYPVTRLLGIDLGERRIGLAIADGDGSAAQPYLTIKRSRDLAADATALEAVVRATEATELVVGLPLEASGNEGPQSRLTRDWAVEMETRLGLPVVMRDERLSSHLAETRLGPMKRGRSGGPPSRTQRDAYRARVDREAAAIILQDELDTRAGLRSSLPLTPDPQETSR